MDPRHEDDPYRPPEGATPASNRAVLVAYAASIGAAVACDSVLNVPLNVYRPGLEPARVWAALDVLLLGYNILVGYVGGRVAARRGSVSHEDARAQWNLAIAVTAASMLVGSVAARFARVAPASAVAPVAPALASLVTYVIEFAIVMLLVRFGFAIGTYGQALLEGRARPDDHDEDTSRDD